jgi:hypothetical protein
MKLLRIVLLWLICLSNVVAQQSLNGRVVDQKTGKGIAFATIVAIDQKNLGAVADAEGNFNIPLGSNPDSLNFHISASSYFSKNVFLQGKESPQLIELEEKVMELNEVVVRPLKEEEINWFEDSENLKLFGSNDENGRFVPMMMGLESSGEFHGNAFKLKAMVMLKEVGFHFFLEEGFPDKLYMRIFSADEKPDLSKNEPLDNLEELTAKTIPLINLKDGFNSVDISGENIIANPGFLIIAVTADINGVPNQKLTIYQQKSSGKEVLRFSLSPEHYTIFPSYLPKYMLGFRYVELEENKGVFGWLKGLFKK